MSTIIVKTLQATLCQTSYSIHNFTHSSSDEILTIEKKQNSLNYRIGLKSSSGWTKGSKKTRLEWARMFIKKQNLIDAYYLCMINDARFILPNLVRFNSRYNERFNYFTILVSYDVLDFKHKFLKLMYSAQFKPNWKYFVENYDSLQQYLKDNLSARQMLIAFVVKFAKINKLWKNKKFKWIIQDTPNFYLKTIGVIRYFDRDQYLDFKSFYYENPIVLSSNSKAVTLVSFCKHIARNVEFDNTSGFNRVQWTNCLKEEGKTFNDACPYGKSNSKECFSFKCPRRKKEELVLTLGNGILNSTMDIVNVFNNKPACIFITNSCTSYASSVSLFKFMYMTNNMHIKFISTNVDQIFRDRKNIIIPNMRYITRVLRQFANIILQPHISIEEVDRFVERISINLYRIKNKRTYKFVKTRLENLYLEYKLK